MLSKKEIKIFCIFFIPFSIINYFVIIYPYVNKAPSTALSMGITVSLVGLMIALILSKWLAKYFK